MTDMRITVNFIESGTRYPWFFYKEVSIERIFFITSEVLK
jgi:hypothetical protein